ncbi:MAG: type II toxin-antitoxin system VapC family toxin [Erythrobacter sp.]
MSDTIVMDASAILSLINGETGAAFVARHLPGSVIGATNFAEVVSKLTERGMTKEDIDETLEGLDLDIRPLSKEQAKLVGYLRRDTKDLGLSLGDRACLALAVDLDATALTCDRAWGELRIAGLQIEIVR